MKSYQFFLLSDMTANAIYFYKNQKKKNCTSFDEITTHAFKVKKIDFNKKKKLKGI